MGAHRVSASLTSPSPRWNPWKRGGLDWTTFGIRLWKESQRDEILGRAAQLAYYFLLALFPALLFLTALIGLFPLKETLPELMQYLRTVLPADALSLLERYLENVVQGSSGDMLSLGLLGALWASSSGVTAIMEALNVVYGATETRPYWKVRVLASLLTVGLAGFIILSITLILYGAHIGEWIANLVGLGWLFLLSWNMLQWPVAVLLMLFALAVIYYVCQHYTRLAMGHTRLRLRRRAVARALIGLQSLRRTFRHLQCCLWIHRRRHRTDAVALPDGYRDPAGRRN